MSRKTPPSPSRSRRPWRSRPRLASRRAAGLSPHAPCPSWRGLPSSPEALSACGALLSSAGGEQPEQQAATTTIMIGPPTNSARVNCQPSTSAMMMPSSIDEVGRRDFERDRRDEVGALAEDRACECDRGVRAGRGRGAECRRDRERAGASRPEQAAHLAFRDDRLHGAGECEAQDQCPEDLPAHPEREREGLNECIRGAVDRIHRLEWVVVGVCCSTATASRRSRASVCTVACGCTRVRPSTSGSGSAMRLVGPTGGTSQ